VIVTSRDLTIIGLSLSVWHMKFYFPRFIFVVFVQNMF
jgi:hypothetical protein